MKKKKKLKKKQASRYKNKMMTAEKIRNKEVIKNVSNS